MLLLAFMGQAAEVRRLIAAGAKVSAWSPEGDTPLHRACKFSSEEQFSEGSDHLATVIALLDAGADVNAKAQDEDAPGKTPLHYCVMNDELLDEKVTACRPLLVRELIKRSANVTAKDSLKFTPLMTALTGMGEEVCDLLLDNGAGSNINAPTRVAGDWIPLLWAASMGNPGSLTSLLKHGADPNVVSATFGGALHVVSVYASDEEATAKARVLLDRGADVNLASRFGTPLRRAAGGGHPQLCELLRKRGGVM